MKGEDKRVGGVVCFRRDGDRIVDMALFFLVCVYIYIFKLVGSLGLKRKGCFG